MYTFVLCLFPSVCVLSVARCSCIILFSISPISFLFTHTRHLSLGSLPPPPPFPFLSLSLSLSVCVQVHLTVVHTSATDGMHAGVHTRVRLPLCRGILQKPLMNLAVLRPPVCLRVCVYVGDRRERKGTEWNTCTKPASSRSSSSAPEFGSRNFTLLNGYRLLHFFIPTRYFARLFDGNAVNCYRKCRNSRKLDNYTRIL